MIEAGAAGVHFEDQLASEKKCGHMGGKVLVPTAQFIRTLTAARLAADVLDVPTVLVARTDANCAQLLTSDVDARDRPFLTGERTPEGFFRIDRRPATSPSTAACRTPPMPTCSGARPPSPTWTRPGSSPRRSTPKFPGKLLAYNCSPSFNWKKKLDDATIARFQRELGAMGYKFQFITLAGFHALEPVDVRAGPRLPGRRHDRLLGAPAARVRPRGRRRLSRRQAPAVRRHRLLRRGGPGVAGGKSSTTALTGSTEEAQFEHVVHRAH